jgi:hypothetical protein
MKLRSVRPPAPPRPSTHACVDTIFIGRTGPGGVQAGRPVGTTQDGTSDSDDAPEPTQPPTGSSTAGRMAGCIARSCHAGNASNAPVRAAGTGAGRSSERRPARRATSRRGAHFTPGRVNGRGIRRSGRRREARTRTSGPMGSFHRIG